MRAIAMTWVMVRVMRLAVNKKGKGRLQGAMAMAM
jgi:hypothetical protein